MAHIIWTIWYGPYHIYKPYHTVYMIWIRFYDKFDSEKLKSFYHKSISIEGPESMSLAIIDLSWDWKIDLQWTPYHMIYKEKLICFKIVG